MRLRIVPTAGLVMVVTGIGCGPVLSNEDLGQREQGIGTAGSMGAGGFRAVELTAVADTTLDKTTPSASHGSEPFCTIRGGSASTRHCLLRWDLSSIPASATIGQSTLTLKISDTDGSASTFGAFQMVRSWSESGATWNKADATTLWEVPGAWGASDSATAVVATPPPTTAGSSVSMTVSRAMLQQWVSDPSTNQGIVFGGGSGDGVSFSTKEATSSIDRPRLVVGVAP
jgi:hypothetical protein